MATRERDLHRTDFLSRDGGEGPPVALTREFQNRVSRLLQLYNGVNPADVGGVGLDLSQRAGPVIVVGTADAPPFRTQGKGWQVGATLAAVAAQFGVLIVQNLQGSNKIAVLRSADYICATAGISLSYGFSFTPVTPATPQGVVLASLEENLANQSTPGAIRPTNLGALAGAGNASSLTGGAGQIIGFESPAASQKAVIDLSGIVLYPGMFFAFEMGVVNTAGVVNVRGNWFDLSQVAGLGAFSS